MKNGTQGFTLIELLIVIAIIGILAAVLIPNLIGARATANARAGQAHSSNVYKALTAALADESSATPTSVIAAYGAANCKNASTAGTAYGYGAAPSGVSTCVAAVNGNDFSVTVNMDATGKSKRFVNGAEVATTTTP